jgi:hypothetical protein
MKKILLTSILVCFIVMLHAQSDTLYTKKQQKIPCKIVEISELDIKYKRADLLDGPVYVISKLNVMKYVLSTGYTEVIVPDELSLENEHGNIIKNRSAIKISPFSPVNNQITLAYEKVLRVGTNLDIEFGYTNSHMTKNPDITGTFNNTFHTGFFIKPGVKFFLGQDYSIRGLKYAHPLKGRYIRLDLAFAYLNYQNVQRADYIYMYGTPYQPSSMRTISTDLTSFAYGGFVNYGRQFILSNVLTLEYYIGAGFTGQSNSYSNEEFAKPVNNYSYYYDDARSISNYHGFLRMPTIGLSITAGFRIGYILPDKSSKDKKKSVQK